MFGGQQKQHGPTNPTPTQLLWWSFASWRAARACSPERCAFASSPLSGSRLQSSYAAGLLPCRLASVGVYACNNKSMMQLFSKLKWSDTQDSAHQLHYLLKIKQKIIYVPSSVNPWCTPKNKAIVAAYRTIRFTSGRCLYRSFTASRYSCFLRSRGRSCKRQDICSPSHTRLIKRNINKLSPRDPAQLMIFFPIN